MGALKNAKHEAYVQNLIRGMTQRKAYLDAYPKCKSSVKAVDERACMLFKRKDVRERYDELMEATAKEAVASLQEIQEYFTKVIRGEIDDSAVTAQGVVFVPVRIGDRNRAAEQLGKMLGGYETNISINTSDQSKLDELLEQRKQRRNG